GRLETRGDGGRLARTHLVHRGDQAARVFLVFLGIARRALAAQQGTAPQGRLPCARVHVHPSLLGTASFACCPPRARRRKFLARSTVHAAVAALHVPARDGVNDDVTFGLATQHATVAAIFIHAPGDF